MSETIIFKPKHELEHNKNLYDFILLATKLPDLNDKVDYDSCYWPKVGNFTKIGVSSKNRDPENCLHESILPFAKAYVKYQQTLKRTKMTGELYALRALECACLAAHGKVEITQLTSLDWDRAAQVAKDKMGGGAAYQAGSQLKKLLIFMVKYKLIQPFSWKNPIKKPAEKNTQTGDEAQKHREEKMPDENALMATAQIFSMPTKDMSPRDIFTSSTVSLLLSAPERGSELFYLKADCIHRETVKAKNKKQTQENVIKLDEDGTAERMDDSEESVDKTHTGLLWFSGKGYGYENKWIPSVMVPIVETAIERLRTQSEKPRKLAKRLEISPDFPRHDLCPDVGEDELLTKEQTVAALGFDMRLLSGNRDNGAVNPFLKARGIERKDYVVTLRDLNKIVRERLPKGFPYVPFTTGDGVKVKWSEALYTQFANGYDKKKTTVQTELWMPHIDTLNEDLAPTKKKNSRTGKAVNSSSLFQRWNHGDLVLTSHQMRHMLDTMAAVNGMSGELRAKWAGRADPKHNRFYNHTSDEEYNHDWLEEQERQDMALAGNSGGQIQVQIATPRTIQELNTKASLTAHATEFGACVQSYLDQPCMKYRDCINCNDQVCIKGEKAKLERLEKKLKVESRLLVGDKDAVDKGVNGAMTWYERRKVTVSRCEELVATLTDPSIEDGSYVRLASVEDVTHLDRAFDANGKKRLPKIENFQRKLASSDEVLGIDLIDDDDEILSLGILD